MHILYLRVYKFSIMPGCEIVHSLAEYDTAGDSGGRSGRVRVREFLSKNPSY